jgi:hypothetical protein
MDSKKTPLVILGDSLPPAIDTGWYTAEEAAELIRQWQALVESANSQDGLHIVPTPPKEADDGL